MTPHTRIAIIDSGVHAAHPHVQGVAGGIALHEDGSQSADYTDRLGHGTAVTAVIRALAPHAEVYAVKVFHDKLSTSVETLISGIDWAIDNGMNFVNLSLGTENRGYTTLLREAVDRAGARDVRIVAAVGWLPGDLPGVTAVALDWECDWGTCREQNGVFYASGFPRPIPGVSPMKNLSGISFAVAQITALISKTSSRHQGLNLHDRTPPPDPA